MKEVIVTANQKGGVGKSTTAHQVASYLSLKGYKTLLIDLDGQANISLVTGTKNKGYASIYDVLDTGRRVPIEEVIIDLTGNLSFIPSSSNLNRVELPQVGRYTQLKKGLKPIMENFDYIVIDTPPMLGDMQLNALAVATKVIVPAQADLYSLDAITDLAETINEVREELNPRLEVAGILLTRYQGRSVLTKEITELIEQTSLILHTRVFDTRIRESVSIKESIANHMDIFTYDKTSNGAIDYKAFCDEFLGTI